MKLYNKHIIQKGEKLQDIVDLYSFPKDDIVFFHNNNCEAANNVLIEITHQKEIFLPRNVVADKNKLVKFSSGNALEFKPENSFYKYNVCINIENGDKQNELKCDVSVHWLKFQNDLHYFEIDRISKMYINEVEANEIADLLAYKTSKVLYPLQISVDKYGEFNAVESLEVFKQRWNPIKEDIYKEFEGEVVDTYIKKIEQTIEEPEIITLLINNDFFLRTLFFGVYQKYGNNYKTTSLQSFPVIKNAIEPIYKVQLEIDPVIDDDNFINIEAYGTLHDERTKYDFIDENPFQLIIEDDPILNHEGNFRLQYYMNSKTGLSENIYLECSIMLNTERKVSITITNLA